VVAIVDLNARLLSGRMANERMPPTARFPTPESLGPSRSRDHLHHFAEADPRGSRSQIPLRQFSGRLAKISHDTCIECDAHADTFDTGLLDLCERQSVLHRADEQVYRFWCDRFYNGSDRIHVREEGRIEYVRSDVSKGHQTPNGIVKMRAALEKVTSRASAP